RPSTTALDAFIASDDELWRRSGSKPAGHLVSRILLLLLLAALAEFLVHKRQRCGRGFHLRLRGIKFALPDRLQERKRIIECRCCRLMLLALQRTAMRLFC